jgi:HK97 family phage prohead protease
MEYREFRADVAGAEDGKVIEGLVTPFHTETVIGDMSRGGFREEVGEGSFTKTLREGDPLMVNQHNMAQPLARKSAGNLDLHEGEYQGQDGLVVRAEPVDTSYARDLRELVKAGVVRGMSFGFQVIKDEWRDDDGKPSDSMNGTHRILREVKLIEVSPVTNPAYPSTAISARDEASAIIEARAGSPKPYGKVQYGDPKNGKYPIDREHVKAAWAYINQAKNAAKYPLNGVSLASVKSRIKAAMKKFGFTSGSAGEKNEYEFTSAEWRDDDPYFDDWYEIDADPEDGEENSKDDPAESREDQEPESSTPDDNERAMDALRMHLSRDLTDR